MTYVNTPESRPMSRGHITVERIHRLRSRHLPVLLVHVVRTTSRIISNPHTEVLHFERSLLVQHVERNDFAIRLLDLSEFHEEVPEAGFGDYSVWSEDSHAVEFGGRVGVCREVAADDLVFVKATCKVDSLVVRSWNGRVRSLYAGTMPCPSLERFVTHRSP